MDDIAKNAAELFINKQYEYAIYLYSNLIEQKNEAEKKLTEMYIKRGNCYVKIDSFENAIEDYTTAIKLDKYNSIAYKKLYLCYMTTGDTSKATEILAESITINEKIQLALKHKKLVEEIEIIEKLINEAYKKCKYDQVIDLIDKRIELLPENSTSHKILKAECLIYLTKFDESKQILNEILSMNKDNYDAISIKGLYLLYQQKYKLGLETLEIAMDHCSKAKSIYETYKNIDMLFYKACENEDEAKEIYLKILKIDPKNTILRSAVLIKLAKICYNEENFNDVLLHCTEVLMADETNIDALKVRAMASQKLGEYEDAVEDCLAVVKLENSEKNILVLDKTKRLLRNNKIDNYAILGVKRGATLNEIRKAWLKLSKIYHPDKKVDNSAEQFLAKRKMFKINKAYEKLKQ